MVVNRKIFVGGTAADTNQFILWMEGLQAGGYLRVSDDGLQVFMVFESEELANEFGPTMLGIVFAGMMKLRATI